MPCDPKMLKRLDAAVDNWFNPVAARQDGTLPVPFQSSVKEAPPRAPFADSPLEMPKENLWEGHPPVPIASL
jgi:hypothetical protein